MAEQGTKILRAAMRGARQRKNNYQCQKRERRPLPQACPCLYPTIINPSERNRDQQAEQDVRQIHRASSQPVELKRIQRGKQVPGDFSGGERFEGTSEEVAEKHHPSGGEADRRREESRDVS